MTKNSKLRFECTQCGKCCTLRGEYAHVYLNAAELKALAAHHGLTQRAFKHRYTFRDEQGWTQLRTESDHCVFLDVETGACSVYEARPTQCRTFPFWRDLVEDGQWNDEVRKMCEGVGQGRLYSIAEVEARMREMEESED